MDTNLDNTSFYITLFSLMVLLGCFYFIYQKIKKMNETIGQIQKHLMYQQNLIEKHNVLLRNTSTNINPNEITQDIPPIPSFINNENIKKEEKPPSVEEKPNPIQTLLPMISSLMGMMNQGEEEIEEEEVEETEERKTEMVKEIETELNELKKVDKNLPTEGRIEVEEEEET